MPRPVEEAPHRKRPWRQVLSDAEAGKIAREEVKAQPDPGLAIIPLATIGPQQRLLVATAEEPKIDQLTGVIPVAAPGVAVLAFESDGLLDNFTVTNSGTPIATVTVTVTDQLMHSYGGERAEHIKKLIWKAWSDASSKGTASWPVNACTSAATDTAWLRWNEDKCTWAATMNSAIWNHWTDRHEQKKMTEAERAAVEARRREADRRAEEERKVRAAVVQVAMNKAERLLMSALNDRQRDDLKNKGYFNCKSQKGHVYRIYKGTHGNVRLLNKAGGEVERLCIQPDNVPDWDAMLAQKLHIEFNEDDFRKTANITRLMN